jgi:PPP family 3-phenylpropionic acid transporter
MSMSERIFRRFEPRHVFLFAVMLALPRWLLTAWIREPWVLVGLQALHGVTFGAFWVAGVAVVSRRAPPQVANSAQALLGVAVGGLGAGLGMTGGGLIVSWAPTWHLFLWGAGAAGLAILATLRALHLWEHR